MLYHLLKLGALLLGSLPLAVRRRLGRLLGRAIACLPTRDRRVAELQLDLFMAPHGGRRLVGRVYAGLVQTLMESLNLTPMLSSAIDCDDPAELQRLIDKKMGVVALTAHTGNWDLMAAYFIRRGVRLSSVGREARSAALHRLLTEIRAGYGIQTLWRGERETLRQIVHELKDGQVVAALIDQDTRVSSLMSPFLGTPAKTPSALIDIARRYNALIVAAFVFRTAPERYTIYLHEIDAALDTPAVLARYHELLSGYLQRFPDQWVWMHKRWRTLPNGDTLSSRRYIAHLEERLAQSPDANEPR